MRQEPSWLGWISRLRMGIVVDALRDAIGGAARQLGCDRTRPMDGSVQGLTRQRLWWVGGDPLDRGLIGELLRHLLPAVSDGQGAMLSEPLEAVSRYSRPATRQHYRNLLQRW